MTKHTNSAAWKKWVVIALFAAAAILSIIFMGKVAINYNLADYLGKDTQTKIALDIVDNEFGMTGNIQVMATNVTPETADEICDKIKDIDNVLNVNFDKYDQAYYKDNNALYVVIVDGDDYSDNAKQVYADIQQALADYDGMQYGGTTVEKQHLQEAITNEMVYILAISLCLVVAILLITSESWLEPLVLLAASGVAVLINRGTNVFFGEISYITNSISAILQLALSVDYSIVLLHAYRTQKETTDDKYAAMSAAIRSVVKPVSASALTTIAGLLALLFMSFRIGFDIGIVLMKGIVISAITSLTLLPAFVLLLDKPMKRTRKKAFAPKGKAFCNTAYKASKVIVPIALVVVIVCGVLQTGNTFIFSDTDGGNEKIAETFGSNNTIIVVYKNTADNNANEQRIAKAVAAYKTADGKTVLNDYTAYTNTVLEAYDVQKAVRKLEITQSDAEMLFTMYNLYDNPTTVTMTFEQFVAFADNLIDTDDDAKEFADSGTTDTIKTLQTIREILQSDLTAEQLHTKLTTGVMSGTDIELFAVNQLYGLYFYDSIADKTVDFATMLDYFVAVSGKDEVKDMFDQTTVSQLSALSAGVAQFEGQMETPLTQAEFKGLMYQNYGVLLDDQQVAQIYAAYFATNQGEPASETIQFLPLMKFLVQSGQLTDETAVATIGGYDQLYNAINAKYGYDQFLPALSQIATGLTGTAPQISATDQAAQQVYIMYFYQSDMLPNGKINGKTFAEYALATDKTNDVVHEQLSDDNRHKLADMLTADKYLAQKTKLTYTAMHQTLSTFKGELQSDISATLPDADKISGVFIKYAIADDNALVAPVTACNLVDFVTDNMDTNSLLKQKLTADNRKKVADAQDDIRKANDLFVGKNYTRMLFSVNLPNESNDTTDFVSYLSDEVKTVFGDDAYITGEVVSTYDLQQSFSHDNLFITVFTLASIFVIVMVIFRSVSLPVILVAVIQGAIFIAMSTQLLGNGIFFMSYIVTTCILMGATIDYGILMSTNYVSYRGLYDKKQALELSVKAAMPTVFSSGLILTVCGFVIHFISSQSSISTVGLLLGIGTICSVVMITVVLPSMLYLLDKFVLALSLKKKNND